MTYCIAFHSYKGGTGKTTIASNLSACLVRQGKTVVLLDLDLYSPSLQAYFRITPKKWINDFLYSSAEISEVMTDTEFDTPLNDGSNQIKPQSTEKNKLSSGLRGQLLLGLAKSKLENWKQLDVSGMDDQKHFFRKLVMLREQIILRFNPDYIVIDTSPGMRYWSLNALAISDLFLLTLKAGDIDMQGTKVMIKEIYESFADTGTKSFLLWNQVAGYCIPEHNSNLLLRNNSFDNFDNDFFDENEFTNTFGLHSLASIPCYCDIQFKKREFLTTIRYPSHPFSDKVESLLQNIETELANL